MSEMRNVNNEVLKNLLLNLESFIKAGRFSFQLLEKNDQDKLVERELCVEFKEDGARLYIKNSAGEIVPVKSKGEDIINEYMTKFLEVGETRKHGDYNPNMWFKISESGDSIGFNQSNIDKFYKFIVDNYRDLVPYIQYTKTSEGVDRKLVPFITTDAVFFDLGRIIQNERIQSLTSSITEMYSFLNRNKDYYDNIISTVENSIVGLKNEIMVDINSLRSNVNNIDKVAANIENKVNQLSNANASISNIIQRRYQPTDIRLGGGRRVLNITMGDNTGQIITGNQREKIGGQIIVYLSNSSGSTEIIELGSTSLVKNKGETTGEYTVYSSYSGGGQILFAIETNASGWRIHCQTDQLVRVFAREKDVAVSDGGGSSASTPHTIPNWGSGGVFKYTPSLGIVTNRVIVSNAYTLEII
ncbi:MAG: hypothetical protein ACRC92_20455 [Peptostreptococcaceae bacterium]